VGLFKLGRDVGLLTASWSLAATFSALLVSVAALSGHVLAEDKSLATLPIALQWLGTAAATIPSRLLILRIGWRAGLSIGNGAGILGAVLCAGAFYVHSFALFSVGIFLIGVSIAVSHSYRFAAAEVAAPAHRPRAVSAVLAGGVLAALIGPELAKFGLGVDPAHGYAGPFWMMAVLGLATALLILPMRIPAPPPPVPGAGRFGPALRQPDVLVAIATAIAAYAVMILLMSVTPLAMVHHHHDFADAAFVIQWHVVGMYAPSFFTGHLIRRFGVRSVMLVGLAILAGSIASAYSGAGVGHFWLALSLLGLGWNFCFIGATTLLSDACAPEHRAKVQAVNDFLVFGTAGLSSLSAGMLLHGVGWQALNLVALPVLVLVAALLAARLATVTRSARPAA